MSDLSHKISKMCWIYFFFTLVFYFLLPLVVFCPILAPLGFHALYYLLGLYLVIGYGINGYNSVLYLELCIGIAIVLILLFLIFFLLAIIKKRYIPFGWITVVSNLLSIVAAIIVPCIYPQMVTIVLFSFPGILGNSVFAWRYFSSLNKLRSVQNGEHVENEE